jgi:hypothetical protein
VRKITARPGLYPLRSGNVIIHIGNQVIDNVGMVQLDTGHLIRFQYRIQQEVRENKVVLTIIRNGNEMKVEVPVGPEHNQ